MMVKQIKEACPFFHFTDIYYILDVFQKNKPHLEIKADQFRQKYSFNQFIESVTKNYDSIEYRITRFNCLELSVYDINTNLNKKLEVYLVEKLENEVDTFIEYCKISQKISRDDLVLQIFDDYYLDDKKLIYVIEYEDYHFNLHDFVSKKANVINFKKSGIPKLLDDIFQYVKGVLDRTSMNIFEITEIINYCSFLFIDQGNSNFRVKINMMNPYLFNPQKIKQNTEQKNNTLQGKNRNFVPFQFNLDIFQIQFQKENVLSQLRESFPKILEFNQQILSQILISFPDQTTFIFEQNDTEYIVFKAITDQKKYSIKVEKISNFEQCQKNFMRLEKLKLIEGIQLETSQMIIYEDSYLMTENQLINDNQFIPIESMKKMNENGLELITYLLEISEQLIDLEIKPSNIFINEHNLNIFIAKVYDFYKIDEKFDVNEQYADMILYLIEQLNQSCHFFGDQTNDTSEKITEFPSFKQLQQLMREYYHCAKDNSHSIIKNKLNEFFKVIQLSFKIKKFKISISKESIDNTQCSLGIFSFVQHSYCYNDLKEIQEIKNLRTIIINPRFVLFEYTFDQLEQKYSKLFKSELSSSSNYFQISGEQTFYSTIKEYIDKCILNLNKDYNEVERQMLSELTMRSICETYDMSNLKLKPDEDQIHNRFTCYKLEYLIYYLDLKTIAQILICSIQEINVKLLFGLSYTSKCEKEDLNNLNLILVEGQQKLMKWYFHTQQCSQIENQLVNLPDYFNLRSKQSLFEFHIKEHYLRLIGKQLKQNKNNINSIVIDFNNDFGDFSPFYFDVNVNVNLRFAIRELRKLSRIVVIKIEE